MGPEATLDLFRKIIISTPAKSDQDHLPIIINNNPQIPDRTDFLLNGGKDPLPALVQSARQLEKWGAELLCMPSNAAHFFLDNIRSVIATPFVSIIEATSRKIGKMQPQPAKVGLLATVETMKTRIYHAACEQDGLEIVEPDEQQQAQLMEIIYGVKAGCADAYVEPFRFLIEDFAEKGPDVVIAGCTELPLLFDRITSPVPVVDPTLALAQEMVALGLELDPVLWEQHQAMDGLQQLF